MRLRGHSRSAVLLLALLAGGCGGTAPNPSPTPTPTAEATLLASATPAAATAAPAALDAELVTGGRFTYCANLRPGRMGFRDTNGEPAGVNIEIAVEIARRLNLEPQIRETPFEELIDAVATGLCDISISSQHITQTRLERIDMLPYTQGSQHVVVQAGNPAGIRVLTDLCGRVLAVQTGSTHVDLVVGQGDHSGAGINRDCAAAGRPDVDLRQFDDDADAIAALDEGTAHGYIGSDFIAVDRPSEFELATELPPTRNGIGVPKDHSALRAAVEAAFQAMVGDGTYLAILERFGLEDASIAN